MDEQFLGQPTKYWWELQKQVEKRGTVDNLSVKELILEIAELRAKCSFIESRLDQINNFRNFRNLR